MASRRVDAVIAGHICLDMIPTFEGAAVGLDTLLSPGKLINIGPLVTVTGGTVANTGLALHRLGTPARLLGKVGDDLVGRAILEVLRAHDPGLAEDMIVAAGHPSSYTIVISPPGVDRIFLHCPGANDTFGAEDVSCDSVADGRLFHFGYPPLMRRMYTNGGRELADILRRAKEAGLTTSLDMALPDPASEAGAVDWSRLLAHVLRYVDVFLPSFEETIFMLDRERFDRMARDGGDLSAQADPVLLRQLAERLLELGAGIVGLKLGPQGFYLRTTGVPDRFASLGACAPESVDAWTDRELLAPCFQVEVVGTTGSGDCTIAGFLVALLHGLSPEEVVTAAVAVGACNVERADATSGISSWGAVQQRVRSGWRRRPVSLPLSGWEWEEEAGVWRGPGDSSHQ